MATVAEIDAEIAKRQQSQDLNAAVEAEINKRIQEQEPRGVLAEIESAFQKIPGAPTLSEFSAGFNRTALGALDFLDQGTQGNIARLINVVQGGGITDQPPPISELLGSEGGFMDPGLARDVVATAGEIVPAALVGGAALRAGAQALPAVQAGTESTAAGLLRQAGQTTAAQDIGFGAASGVGAATGEEIGGPVGELIGSVLAPIGAQAAVSGLKGLIGLGGKGISMLSKSIENMSDEGAAQLLSEAMVREGISPDDFARQLAQLGPEALPADVGNNFARLLRVASNKVPRIEGRAGDVFRQRQAGQSDRIIDAFDDASGTSTLNIADEIERLNIMLGPKIKQLYDQIRGKSLDFQFSPASGSSVKGTKMGEAPSRLPFNVKKLFEGKNSVSMAAKKAQGALNDRKALGEKVGDIDLIDETKKVMDDQIGKALRMGENNRVRMLVSLKNKMVDEADRSIPIYKEARDLFAGKAQLESAADAGTLFVKLKPRELADLTKTYGTSEKKMFKLGAKQALLDKVDSLQMNADAVKRLFGKNGDVKKLKSLFDEKGSPLDRDIINRLPEFQQDAVKDFSALGSINVNKRLRAGENPRSNRLLGDTEGLDFAIAEVPLPKSVNLFRKIEGADIPELQQNLTGKVFTDKGYLSTSTRKEVTERFTDSFVGDKKTFTEPVLFKINAAKGEAALPLPGAEREVLLPRDAKLNVISDKIENGVRTITANYGTPSGEAGFKRFSDALERESKFIATRNAAQANSTTAKQLADEGTAEEVFGATMSLLGSPIQSATAFGRILSGLSGKKGSEAFTRSLEKVGDILLTRGMDAKKIEGILRRGSTNEIENALKKIMIRPLDAAPASLAGGVSVVSGQ